MQDASLLASVSSPVEWEPCHLPLKVPSNLEVKEYEGAGARYYFPECQGNLEAVSWLLAFYHPQHQRPCSLVQLGN